MIARIAAVLVALVAVAAVVLTMRGGEEPPAYGITFDNAFGLTEGTDLRAAGVRVGSVKELDVDPETARAIVTVTVEDEGFGDLRADARCSIEPQSLIGEYFVDCVPGDGEPLTDGATIPVEQTTGTIPPDLINNIMRRPWRERFGIILAELGAGLAARGPELQATIRRAIPALRETDRVLAILAANRQRLRRLNRDADTALAGLAERRDDVADFVVEARDTAAATAERRADLETDLQLLPPFLRELRPTLAELRTTVRRQTPALRNVRAAADDLELVFSRLGPFAGAAEPALRSLGEAGETGTRALRALQPTAQALGELGGLAADPMRNLRLILEHVDDRDFAVEPNPLSPDGKGFTGLEAFLQYPFVQSQAINIFDARGYLLKLNVLPSRCSAYRDAESVRNDPELREECSAALGPGPDIGIDDGASTRRAGRTGDRGAPRRRRGGSEPDTGKPAARGDEDGSRPNPLRELLPGLPDLPPQLRDLLDGAGAGAGLPRAEPGPVVPREQSDALLDFLFGA